MHDPKKPTERAESPTPTPEPDNGGLGATVMDRATRPGDIVVADGLPLERLYARFDAIARGRAPGNSSAAHQSVLERLASNQQRAEALGWSEFVLERAGGSGRGSALRARRFTAQTASAGAVAGHLAACFVVRSNAR